MRQLAGLASFVALVACAPGPRREAGVDASGNVLVTGGDGSSSTTTVVSTSEVYDVAAGTWSPAGAMMYAREAHSATLLPSGFVLASGGYVGGTEIVTDTTELFNPSTFFDDKLRTR
jgi:hypothetical protein